jgi:hypothetical protein
MLRRVCAVTLFLLALVPSALLAWQWRSLPHLGFYHDDGIYWVCAKSLAEGHGYHIASLPDEPFQTKYPPVFPALLAIVWKLNPTFPENLPLATLCMWLVLPIYLWLVRATLKGYGFSSTEQAVLCFIAGVNPMCALLSFSLMPELLFTSLLLAAFLLAERFPILSGMAAALAYLTRSAALPLLLTVPLWLFFRRRKKNALSFIAIMLPAVLGWQFWVLRHVSPSQDLITLYYTNYLGFQLYNVGWTDLPTVIWHNLDALLLAIGKLLLFDIGTFGSKHLDRIIAIGAIAGVVRLARRTGNMQYPLAALGVTAMLLIWHYQPDQRFVFPLYPLLLAGIWTELRNIVSALRSAWNKRGADRVVAAVGAGAFAALAVFFAFTTAHGLFRVMPELMSAYQSDLAHRRPAYEWIAKQSAGSATVFAYDDPVMFLYTGRKSCSLPLPPKLFYYQETRTNQLVRTIPEFARQNRLDYLLVTSDDFYRDLHGRGVEQLAAGIRGDAALERTFYSPAASIYRVIR